MNRIRLLFKLMVLITFAFFTSCKKNELGGSSQINGTVINHSTFFPNARIFIKFNATEFPGTDTNAYNAKIRSDAKGEFTIKCYKGNYFLYALGYDDLHRTMASGGIPVKIRTNEKINVDLPLGH